MPPTSSIVRNLAEEIRGRSIGKNWTGQFVRRNAYRLKSLYLRNIDNLRIAAEYAPMFTLFFTLVCIFLVFFYVFGVILILISPSESSYFKSSKNTTSRPITSIISMKRGS